jgi:hypothetical protein
MTEKVWNLDTLLGPEEREINKIPWPGKPDKIVGLRVVPDEVLRQCDERVRAWAEKTGIPYNALNMLNNAEYLYAWAAEVVSEALVDPETGQKLCKDSKQLTTGRRRDIIQIIFTKYSQWCKDTLPEDPDKLVQEEFDGLIENLKAEPVKEQQVALLGELDMRSLRNLCLCMVGQLQKFTGSKS